MGRHARFPAPLVHTSASGSELLGRPWLRHRPPLRSRYSLPTFAFAVAFLFILVYIIVPDPNDTATAAPGGTFSTAGQSLLIAGENPTAVSRDTYSVTQKEIVRAIVRPAAGAPAAGRPDPGTAQAIAHDMVMARGWGEEQYNCLVALWNRESHWNVYAYNPSGAYGIPQALPGSKMASAGADWQTNPATQITWGLGYITARYGTPCGAWGSSQSKGWY